ncbi:MAG: NADH-quinone oxidoreductase subunit M [Chloroflexi bacterium]|jgi:NADH-quinone oxidoreductase subunit M|nr:NADH-quinone oxidoreductase subunit M [Chloroflexota bacterium]
MNNFDESVLTLLLVLPFAAALALVLWPGDELRPMKWFSAAVALATTVLVAWVILGFDYTEAEQYQFVSETEWLTQLGIGFNLGVDGIAVAMLALTGIAFPAAILVGWNVDARSKDYLILLNLLVGGVYGTFVSLDLFFLFFFYEIAVLPMYLLIAFWGSSTNFPRFTRLKEYSAMKLVLFLVGGSVLIWISIIAMFVEADLNTFNLVDLQRVGFDESFQNWVFPLLMIGFGLLGGLWPLHTWSPDGHVSAPTSVSMLHAGVLMKLGAFGIIRVGIQTMPEGAEAWAPLLLGLGAVNVIYGSIAAMSQTDLKYVIGYSSVSHMGYVFLGLATLHTLGVTGAVLQMFSHGIMTALMFTLAGAVYHSSHTRDIGVLSGLAKVMPVGAFFFAVAGFASLGLPGFSGFVAEMLVFLGLFQTYPWIGALAVIGAGITAVYMLRLMAKVYFGETAQRWETLPDLKLNEKLVAGTLALTLLIVGLAPFYLIDVIREGVRHIPAVTG